MPLNGLLQPFMDYSEKQTASSTVTCCQFQAVKLYISESVKCGIWSNYKFFFLMIFMMNYIELKVQKPTLKRVSYFSLLSRSSNP